MIKKQNANLIKIVNALSDGGYHDGTTLGLELGMTRSAIWKTMQKLSAYGVKIDSIKRRGYALQEPLILLDRNKIRPQLSKEFDKLDLQVYESVASTNDLLLSQEKNKNIKICIAEKQTQGKGRLGRQWHSPFGTNIYLSCLYTFQKDVSVLAGLSLVVSLAILSALKEYGLPQDLCVKWPNDVLYKNKKMAGILIEVQAETHMVSHAIIGIGMNVNMSNAERQITQPWTSISNVLNKYVDRNNLAANLINTLLINLKKFNEVGFEYFAEQWMQADCLTNQTITLKNLNKKISGKALGVNEHGNLRIRLKNGEILTFSSGETSIVRRLI